MPAFLTTGLICWVLLHAATRAQQQTGDYGWLHAHETFAVLSANYGTLRG